MIDKELLDENLSHCFKKAGISTSTCECCYVIDRNEIAPEILRTVGCLLTRKRLLRRRAGLTPTGSRRTVSLNISKGLSILRVDVVTTQKFAHRCRQAMIASVTAITIHTSWACDAS
ncbi:hypothetical protein [Rhodopirellula baltica]|uniref:Uncharacterized protein n=1 Tax=Rhodopirellula baltica SWK14 TaxID=993516 RepID=L7C7Q0_RHOBT|nr:hypothetical protein [Rhodopirellula baltica]ELP29707.1 hypothetical protein RBSWK_06408 [Rhodopirellula baltica SWK14]